MKITTLLELRYDLDEQGYLRDPAAWNQDFVLQLAPKLGIPQVTEEHWKIIRTIREFYNKTGQCPVVYHVCRANGLTLGDLGQLFPSGYLRGACRLAGLSHSTGYLPFSEAMLHPGEFIGPLGEERPPGISLPVDVGELETQQDSPTPVAPPVTALAEEKIDISRRYEIDGLGYLTDPDIWHYGFARLKAAEMKCAPLIAEHWRVLLYLRARFYETHSVPTVAEACERLGLTVSELERLFPDGWNRGVIKLAGLRPGQ